MASALTSFDSGYEEHDLLPHTLVKLTNKELNRWIEIAREDLNAPESPTNTVASKYWHARHLAQLEAEREYRGRPCDAMKDGAR